MKREREHHWAGCSCTEFVTYHGDTYCTTCGIRKARVDQARSATLGDDEKSDARAVGPAGHRDQESLLGGLTDA